MALINREENGAQTALYRAAVRTLAQKLSTGRCLLFLGAGVSLADPPRPGLHHEADNAGENPAVPALAGPVPVSAAMPDGRQLARDLLDACGLTEQMSLSQAASYYEFFYGRDELDNELLRRIANPQITPSRSIQQLVDFLYAACPQEATFAVTTNYDRQFEDAYRKRFGAEPKVVIYKGASVPGQPGQLNTFMPPEHEDDGAYWQPKPGCSLYKIHGCISQRRDRGLVITEEDYINFLTNAMAGQPAETRAC